MAYTRTASHAGPNGTGWYEATPTLLKEHVDALWRTSSSSPTIPEGTRMMGLIAPHAGITYSGRIASAAYNTLRNYLFGHRRGLRVERVFVLGPSHTKGFNGIELSSAVAYQSPFGDVPVDVAAVAAVRAAFEGASLPVGMTTRRTDEDEHSIEMQMPFLAHMIAFPPQLNGHTSSSSPPRRLQLVPIICGWAEPEMEARMAEVMMPFFEDERNLFIFSSDFSHWGKRFRYTYHYEPSTYPDLQDSVVAMNHKAMEILEATNPRAWYEYLDKTQNTICGRHPISVGLPFWSKVGAQVKFVGYGESSRLQSMADSSVSYAAAIITQQ